MNLYPPTFARKLPKVEREAIGEILRATKKCKLRSVSSSNLAPVRTGDKFTRGDKEDGIKSSRKIRYVKTVISLARTGNIFIDIIIKKNNINGEKKGTSFKLVKMYEQRFKISGRSANAFQIFAERIINSRDLLLNKVTKEHCAYPKVLRRMIPVTESIFPEGCLKKKNSMALLSMFCHRVARDLPGMVVNARPGCVVDYPWLGTVRESF